MRQFILMTIILFLGLTQKGMATQFIDTLSVGDFVIPDAASVLDVSSTTAGSRPCPNMTEVQRDAIALPPAGLCVYNTTQGQLNIYDGASWNPAGGLDLTAPPLRINDGMSYDRQDITLAENAGNIEATLQKDGGGDIRFQIGGVEYTLDTTPALTANLTAGASASSPQINYLYLDLGGGATPTFQISTTEPTGEFVWIATALVPDAVTFVTTGPYMFQRWSDTTNFVNARGALSYEREKIRRLGASWYSGVASTVTITPNVGVPDNVVFDSTAGTVYQMHKQTFPAFTSPTTYYVVNHPTTPYLAVTDLNALLVDANNASMADKRFGLVIWGSVNHDGTSKLYVNLPTGSYSSDDEAIHDINSFAVTTVPTDLKGTAFLIGRLVLRHRSVSGGTWTNLLGGTTVSDLRGQPLGIKGVGGSGGGTLEFSDANFEWYNVADDTKKQIVDASAITTGTTRTMTFADRDLNLAFPLFDYVDFLATTPPAYAEGRVFYDSDSDTLAYYNAESDVVMNLGAELWVYVRNSTGSTITDGQVVYVSGATGQVPTIALAQADALATSSVLGVATHDIENNTNGYITVNGVVNNINTAAFLDGDIVYLSAVTPGALTTTKPAAPNFARKVGVVTYANGTNGKLLVQVERELATYTNGSVFFYDSALGFQSQDNANFFWDDTNNRLGLMTNTPDSTLDVQGSISKKVAAITATDTMDASDYFWRVDPAAATTINLPTAVGITGREYVIYAVDVDNAITVDGNGTETIGGSTTYAFSIAGETLTIISNGTNWDIVSSSSQITEVAQAQLWGSCKWEGVASCDWVKASSSSYTTMDTVDSDCNDPTTTGKASAPATKVPQCHFDSFPAGNYQVLVNGHIYTLRTAADTNANPSLRVTDGTNFSVQSFGYFNDSTSNIKGVSFSSPKFALNNASNLTNVNISLQFLDATAGNSYITASNSNQDFEIAVYRFPSSSQVISETPAESTKGYFNDTSACSPNLSTTVTANFVNVTDAACAYTNESGTPLTRASNSIGGYRYFKAGKYQVIWLIPQRSNATILRGVYRTAYCSGTSICGVSDFESGRGLYDSQEGANDDELVTVISELVIPSDGNWFLNLQNKVDTATSVTTNEIIANLSTGNRRIEISIVPIENTSSLRLAPIAFAEASSDAGQSVTSSGDVFIAEDESYDNYGAYNVSTGEFTSPIAGVLTACAVNRVLNAAYTTSESLTSFLFKNGANFKRIDSVFGNGASGIEYVAGDCIQTYTVAGDIWKISITSSNTYNLTTSGLDNHLSFKVVP